MPRPKYEYVMSNGNNFAPQNFVSTVAILVETVNARRKDSPPASKRAHPVIFWYMGVDGAYFGADETPVDEGGESMNLRTVRAPPYIDWVLVAGPGGRHAAKREPDLTSGCIRHYVEVPFDWGALEAEDDLPPEEEVI